MTIGRATKIFFILIFVSILVGRYYSWQHTSLGSVKEEMEKVVQVQSALKSYQKTYGQLADVNMSALVQAGLITPNTIRSNIAKDSWQLVWCAKDGNLYKISDSPAETCLYMVMPAYFACLLEEHLDDKRLDDGVGRLESGINTISTVPIVYGNCFKTSSKKGGYFLSIM